jgi:hypothetical protein
MMESSNRSEIGNNTKEKGESDWKCEHVFIICDQFWLSYRYNQILRQQKMKLKSYLGQKVLKIGHSRFRNYVASVVISRLASHSYPQQDANKRI